MSDWRSSLSFLPIRLAASGIATFFLAGALSSARASVGVRMIAASKGRRRMESGFRIEVGDGTVAGCLREAKAPSRLEIRASFAYSVFQEQFLDIRGASPHDGSAGRREEARASRQFPFSLFLGVSF